MTANPMLSNLTEEQKALVYNVREIFPTMDTTDCVNLCKSCNWSQDSVNSRLFESSFEEPKWKAIDRTSRRKKKDGEKTNFNDFQAGSNQGGNKKKKAFNRRQRRGKFDRKGRGKPKDRKKDSKKGGDSSDSKAKHLIQRTNAVTNTSAGSWAAKARAPPRALPRPNPSPQRDPSSKSENSRKENEVSNSSSEHLAHPPGIINTSVWTNVHNNDEPEPEVNHSEQYANFFDPEQFNTQAHLVEPEKPKMYAGENLSSYPDTQIYSATKYPDHGVKAELNPSSFQIDHDRRSSASQYSRPIENIESTGVELRIGTEGPEYNIPGEPYVPEPQFQFGDITNAHPSNPANTHDSRSRPVSDNSSAVGATPFSHSMHKGGVTMPAPNPIFPTPTQQDPRGGLSVLGSLVLPPEQEQLKMNGTAIYHFGVDFSEERKIESNEHHHPPNHLPPHVRGDPTQQVLQRPVRMEYAERPHFRPEVSHEMNRTVNVNRNNRERPHQVDSRFHSRLDTSNQNQHANFEFEDIGPSIMGSGREPLGKPPLTHQRLETHFEERKSNHIEIDDPRNPNRINNNTAPVHQAQASILRSVPAEVVPEAPFFEAKRMEPPNRGFEEPQPAEYSDPHNVYQHSHQPNYHTHHVPNQPQAFKPKQNTSGFKEAGYVQSAPYGVEQLQNLEENKNGPSQNTNTEYQQHHHVPAYTNQITYYTAYTAPVQTFKPSYQHRTYTAPRTTVGYPYSAQVVSTNAVYSAPYSTTQPVGVYPVR